MFLFKITKKYTSFSIPIYTNFDFYVIFPLLHLYVNYLFIHISKPRKLR